MAKKSMVITLVVALTVLLMRQIRIVQFDIPETDCLSLIELSTGTILFDALRSLPEKQLGKDFYGYAVTGPLNSTTRYYGRYTHSLDDQEVELALDARALYGLPVVTYVRKKGSYQAGQVFFSRCAVAIYDCLSGVVYPLNGETEMEIRHHRISISSEIARTTIKIAY